MKNKSVSKEITKSKMKNEKIYKKRKRSSTIKNEGLSKKILKSEQKDCVSPNKSEDNDSAYDEGYENDSEKEIESYNEDGSNGLTNNAGMMDGGLKRKVDEHSNSSFPWKRRKEDVSKQALPNADEINKWREIQFLHHSNLFRLQMNEMLSQLEIKEKTRVRINSWLSDFSTFLKALPSSRQFQLNKFEWVEEQKIHPLPLKHFFDLPGMNGNFCFCPPEEVALIGSFPLGLTTLHSPTIDVALILPKEFMQKNDLSNGKWLLRRALYLAWVGKALQSSGHLVSSISWTQHCGSPLRPVLQLTASGKLGSTWKINLFPVPSSGYFKVTSISPNKANVSLALYFRRQMTEVNAELSTPHYNWLCGVDVVMMDHHKFIKAHLSHLNWIQGVIFLKIWMTQRNFTEVERGITSHLITLYVIHLAKIHKVSPQMSPYQVFRVALLHLTQTDWLSEGPSLFNKENVPNRNQIILSPADFHRLYPVVFVDPTGYLNLAADVSVQGYLELQHQAKTALEILQLSSGNSFDALFIQKVEFHITFDQTIQIQLDNETMSRIFNAFEANAEAYIVDRLGDIRNHVIDRIASTLSRGLGDRVDFIGLLRSKIQSWSFGSNPPALSYDLTLGLLVNPRTSTALLTKGPSADCELEAQEFRNFWGELSCLRRFKDSTFHEAVLWAEVDDRLSERRLIVGKVVTYLMKTTFKVSEDRISYVAGQLENVLRMPYEYENDDNSTFKYGTGEEVITLAILAFDSLSKKLRSFDLSLKISTIQSVSDVFKHSSVYPSMSLAVPKPYIGNIRNKAENPSSEHHMTLPGLYKNCPLYRPTIEMQIFLEISGKWPDDLLAIQAIKVEFMCKIADLLRQNSVTAVVFPTYLQVVWEGYVFTLKVCYRREIYLLRALSDDRGSGLPELDTEASVNLEKEIEILPRMTSSLNSLQSNFPSFSGAVRLVRRWVSSQLLLPHFPHIVIDLLVAHIYLVPYPHKPPNTPHVALLRFMNFVTKTEWKSSPLFVNLGNQFNDNDESELMKRFTEQRSSLPPIFVCTPCELRPLVGTTEFSKEDLNHRYALASCWSRSSPSLPILSRIKLVARAALETFSMNMWKKNFDFMVLFRPPLHDYDVLIFLNEYMLSRRFERIGRKNLKSLKKYKHIKGEKFPVVAFDPAQLYLRELRASFDSHALFFHDEHGGNVIGVVWKPHVFQEKGPKMGSLEGHKLFGIKEVKQVVNVDAIVEEFKLLGEDVIKEVQLKS